MWICLSLCPIAAVRTKRPWRSRGASIDVSPWICSCALRGPCGGVSSSATGSCAKSWRKGKSSMNPLVLEWLQKADGDFEAMQQLARVRNRPSVLDGVCFHAQQCAEKYLKARLQESGKAIPKIHDLIGLLELLLPVEPMLEPLRPALFFLNRYAVDFRYPGHFASREEGREAVVCCRKVRVALRETLGLESQTKLRKQSRRKL